MSLQKYAAFVQTVELGSFTKAADKLGYTQSGISHMVAALEEEWGTTLLERGRAGVQPTSEGARLLPYAQAVCAAQARLAAEVDDMNGLQTGFIRVGTLSSIATHWLPGIIRSFKQDYPNIEFELLLGDYTEIESWALDGRIDFGFLRLPATPQLESISLAKDRLMAVLPRDHPLATAERFPVSQLEGAPFMILEKGAKNEIAEIFELQGVAPDIQFTTWDDYAIMAMVEEGLGISILPELILKRIPYKIVARELDPPAWRQIGIVLKKESDASRAARRFIEYIKATVSELY